MRDWMDTLEIGELIDRRQPDILVKYSQVLTHLQANPCYQEAALREWSKASVAGPWIISIAAAYGYAIITLEKPIPGRSPKTPTKKPKIPDVARALGVQTQNLLYLMRKLKFKL